MAGEPWNGNIEVFSDLASLPLYARGAVVLLGSFDGLHRGHQQLVRIGRAVADRSGCKLAVFSVEPHPREFFGISTAPFRLVSAPGKLELLAQCGVDIVYMPRFDQDMARTSPQGFVGDVLGGALAARHIVIGADYRFGKGRAGDAAMMVACAAEQGCGTTVVPKLRDDGLDISSTRVRALVRAGEIGKARSLLGHHWPMHFASPVRFSTDEWGRAWAFAKTGAILTPERGRFDVDIRCESRGIAHKLPGCITFHPADAAAAERCVVVEILGTPESLEHLSAHSVLVHDRL